MPCKNIILDVLLTYKNNIFVVLLPCKNNILLDNFEKDHALLDLMNNIEFFGLYAFTDNGFLYVRITSSYFVDAYEKLETISKIICRVIDHLYELLPKLNLQFK